jgi:hypothetical protein
MKSAFTKYVCWTTLAAATTLAHGGPGNLLINPDFDTSLNGWTSPFNTSVWVSNEDYQGSASSGAALVTVPALFESAPMQCAGVNGNTTYVARTSAKSVCGGDAELDLYWADEDCNAGTTFSAQIATAVNAWESFTVTAKAPNQRGSAIVVLRNNGTCHENVYFDAVSLLPDHIFSDSFDKAAQSQ